MIPVTRPGGRRFLLNSDLVERVEETPETLLTLVDGTRYIVAESLDEVLRRVRIHRAAIISLANQLDRSGADSDEAGASGVLRLLPTDDT